MNDSDSNSENVKRLVGLAKAAEAGGHNCTAYEIYKRVMRLASKRESTIYRAALNLIDIGRLSDAEAHLMRLKWNAASKPWLIEWAMGRLRSEQGRLLDAERHFRKTRKLNPQKTEWAIFLADSLFKQEKFDEAKKVLLASTRAKGNLDDELYLNLGCIERAKGNYHFARDYFLKALEITPDYPSAQKGLDDVQSCLDSAKRNIVAQAMNDSESNSENVKKLFALAKDAEASGHDSTAYELYRRVMSLDPKRDSAIYRAALSLIEIGRVSDAEAHLMRLKWNAPPKPWLVERALGELRSAQGRLLEGEKHFAKAWKLNSNGAETVFFLADCLFKLEKFDDAKSVLLESKVARDDLDELYRYLGLVERAEGDYAAARDYFLKSLEITPDYSDAQKALDDVQSFLDLVERGVL